MQDEMNNIDWSGIPVYGVDFSGAQQAGRAIWVCTARQTNGGLLVESCLRGDRLPQSAGDRNSCLRALAALIANSPLSAWGLDFPFSLPAELITADSWPAFAGTFADAYSTHDVFRHYCRRMGGPGEKKRATDCLARVPFSPYNLRVYRQTYYGIRDLLAPLVAADSVRVVPMQPIAGRRPILLEACPASFLKRHALYRPYKGAGTDAAKQRAHILQYLESEAHIAFSTPAERRAVLENSGGDALDSVLAAVIVGDAISQGVATLLPVDDRDAIEGRVYF